MDNPSTKYYYREKHIDLFLKVRQIINEVDPKGLIELCGPEEYDIEVEDIMTKLKDCNSPDELKEMVIAVFTRWFDDPGSIDSYEKVGYQLLEVKHIMPNT